MSFKISSLRQELATKPCIGTWMQTRSQDIAELITHTDFSWVALDLEHGNADTSLIPDISRIFAPTPKLFFCRTLNSSSIHIRRCLDLGADGVIVPNVKSYKEAKSIIDTCLYPPFGNRGVGFCRSNQYGLSIKDSLGDISARPFVAVMCESVEFVREIAEITTLQYLDAIFIGPYDLSASLGCPGEFTNPDYINTLEYIKSSMSNCPIPLGIHVVQPDHSLLQLNISAGYRLLAFSIDTLLFLRGASISPHE